MANRKSIWGKPEPVVAKPEPKTTTSKPASRPRYQPKTVKPALPGLDVVTADDPEDGDDDE